MNTVLTLSYESQTDNEDYHSKTTVTKEFYDPTFDEVYQALAEMCLSLGFSADTVKLYFKEM
jgi:hypothetical protein